MSFPLGFVRSFALAKPPPTMSESIFDDVLNAFPSSKNDQEVIATNEDKHRDSLSTEPASSCKTENDVVLSLSKTPKGNYFSVVTEKIVYIWSGGLHRVCVGTISADESNVKSFQSALWRPEKSGSLQIAVLSNHTMIIIFAIKKIGQITPVKRIQVQDPCFPLLNLRPVTLEQVSTVNLQFGAVCMANCGTNGISVAEKGNNLSIINWEKRVFDFRVVLPVKDEFSQIHGHGKKTVVGLITLGGKCLLYSPGFDAVLFSSEFTYTAIKFSEKRDLFALGCKSGEIFLNSFVIEIAEKTKRIVTSRIRTILLKHISSPGPVLSFSWNAYNALAACWEKAVCVTQGLYSSPSNSIYTGSCSALCWTENDNSLIIAPKHSQKKRNEANNSSKKLNGRGFYDWAELLELQFVRCSTDTSVHTSPVSVIYGGRMIAISKGDGHSPSDICIPSQFVADNFPIKFVCVSRDGDNLCVAGKRGIAVYQIDNKRWRIFADREQEREIRVNCMCWYMDTIILLSKVPHKQAQSNEKYKIRIYPRTFLDKSSLLHESDFPPGKVPILCDCNEHSLIVLTADSSLYQYQLSLVIENGTAKSVDVTLLNNLKLAAVSHPLTIALLPIPSNSETILSSSSSQLIPASRLLILHENGVLTFFNCENSKQDMIGYNIEQFWVTHNIAPLRSLGTTILWAYGGDGIQLWPSLSLDNFDAKTHHSQWLSLTSRKTSCEFDADVFPIGVSTATAACLGVEQRSVSECYDFVLKIQPYLPSLLKRLLFTSPQSALDLAHASHRLPFFERVLELLLYEVLEDDESTEDENDKGKLLEITIDFLRRFPSFAEIVTMCARKTDVSSWAALFAPVGSPKTLVDCCIETGRFHIASLLLRVVLHLEGKHTSTICALRILDLALGEENYALVSDLLRFLSANEMDDYPVTEAKEEIALFNHAKRMISKKEVKKLIKFATLIDRNPQTDITNWLQQERDRGALLDSVSDYVDAISGLIRQYSLHPKPDDVSGINFFCECCKNANCVPWVFVCAAFVGNAQMIRELFKEDPNSDKPDSSNSDENNENNENIRHRFCDAVAKMKLDKSALVTVAEQLSQGKFSM